MRTGFFITVFLLLASAEVSGDAYGERGALARLDQEIAALGPVIREAEAQGGSTRVRFRYDWLRQDLARVRLGIQAHIAAPPPTPRPVEPLRGDYRR